MIQYRLLYLIFSIILIPVSGMSETQYSGFVRVPAGKAPSDCYTILRNGTKITPEFQDEHVFNGDQIYPKNNISITLFCRHSDCPKQDVEKITTVNCDPGSVKKIRLLRFKEMLISLLKEKRVLRHHLESIPAVTKRNLKNEQYDFFNFPHFEQSPLPSDGANILYDQNILFRYNAPSFDNAKTNSTATLVVKQQQDPSNKREYDIMIGKIRLLDGSVYKAGTTYEWYLMQNNKVISQTYHFNILNQKSSENINLKLLDIEQDYANDCPGLKQALFLCLISQSVPDLDLSADSLRLIWNNRYCNDQSSVWELLFKYCQ